MNIFNRIINSSFRVLRRGGAAVAPVLLCACSSIDCPVENTIAVYYYAVQKNAAGEIVADTIRDTLWVWTQRSDGRDTLLNSFIGKTSFSLPVSYQYPEDMLVFAIRDTSLRWTLDTVWLGKNDMPHFESVDCPAHFFHEITSLKCTHDGIDSMSIVNPSVTYNKDARNINIFLKKR